MAGKAWLVLCSLFFYSWWNVVYLPLIVISMLVNYLLGTVLARRAAMATTTTVIDTQHKIPNKYLLVAGVVFNLGFLGFFKYADFVVANMNALGASFQLPGIVLPLAISFFTFQQVAYLVDSYKGDTQEYDVINYALFITFFPQLIAGPIVHHREMMPQFASRWSWVKRYRNIVLGLCIFSVGLFKKVVIADTFEKWATPGFDTALSLSFIEAWITSLSYSFQLYFDFSGYTDMAIGAALLFNIKLPVNFNSPYKALDIQDFWRRWHMTLSRFLRDYLYIPLGGNRKGSGRTYINLFATFVLGGLWHGASWMFVIWGALHGGALIVHRLWQKLGVALPKVIAWLVTFNFVNIAWVFFRAESMGDALKVLYGMFGLAGLYQKDPSNIPTADLAWGGSFYETYLGFLPLGLAMHGLAVILLMAGFFIVSRKNATELAQQKLTTSRVIGAALLAALALIVSFAGTSNVFLYFNF